MPSDNPTTGMERGLMVERFIGNFSSQFFMKDFVHINVKYTSGGQLKSHPADLLFVLDDECIVVSVKGTDGEPKSEEKPGTVAKEENVGRKPSSKGWHSAPPDSI